MNKKQNKGITLIALVITIIVLLILAGVSITTLLGDDGILTRAKEAANKTKEAEVYEKIDLWKIEKVMADTDKGESELQTADEFAKELLDQDKIDEYNISTGEIKLNGKVIGIVNKVSNDILGSDESIENKEFAEIYDNVYEIYMEGLIATLGMLDEDRSMELEMEYVLLDIFGYESGMTYERMMELAGEVVDADRAIELMEKMQNDELTKEEIVESIELLHKIKSKLFKEANLKQSELMLTHNELNEQMDQTIFEACVLMFVSFSGEHPEKLLEEYIIGKCEIQGIDLEQLGYNDNKFKVDDYYSYGWGFTPLTDNNSERVSVHKVNSLSINEEFKTAINNNTNYEKDGKILWNANNPLPKPQMEYEGVQITSFQSLFDSIRLDKEDLQNFNETSSIIDMSSMFDHTLAREGTINVSYLNTSNVKYMEYMFDFADMTSLDISSWNTNNVINMNSMFYAITTNSSNIKVNTQTKDKIDELGNSSLGNDVQVVSVQ